MEDQNYIPIEWRYYIALMAVSTMKCEYLMNKIEEKFISSGGNTDWLVYGVEKIPEKLKLLLKINNILAHQPWKLPLFDMNLLFGSTRVTKWNFNEFIHAMLIMITFHKLSTIIMSIGMKFKGDLNVQTDDKGILLIFNN